jgi:NADP-dependent aldehyde dehydrogenase
LTGTIYSDVDGSDDALYDRLAPRLRVKIGRLLNDKMPTGVAVSPAMNHGGPYPATGHPGFTAVGIPTALRRFTALACYDNVREARLPAALRNKNPTSEMWRLIDGQWTQADIP